MHWLRVEPVQIPADIGLGGADAVIGLEVHTFIFDTAPQSLNEYVVPPGATPVHRELAVAVEHGSSELIGGELPWSVLTMSGSP